MEKKEGISLSNKDLKVKNLLIKAGIISTLTILFLSIFLLILNLIFNKRETLQKQIKKLESTNRNVIKEIKDIEIKSITAKNYISIWNSEFSEQQKLLKGIDVSELAVNISKIGENDNLKNIVINFSPVILVGGTYERKKVRTYTALINIKFSAITDINVFKFLNDLKDNLGYFIVFTDISLERTKKIDDDFLKSLKNPDVAGAINGEIKIRLYGLGEK